MIDIDRIYKIAKDRNYTKLSVSSFPTWIDEHRQEGFEVKAGMIRSFWMIAGEKNYIEPPGEHMKNTLILFDEVKEDGKIKEPESKIKEPKTESTKEIQTTAETILPEFLTAGLMAKWAALSTTERILLFQKTPPDKIKQVQVGKDKNGVEQYAPYVEGNYMFREANAAFLFDWELDIKDISISATGVSVRGVLSGYFSEYGRYLSRPATGYQELNKKVDAQLALKGATTDAIKKGLSLFGFNSDVYGGEV